jgi:catechol 2,3-dioxygenase-like lactoylglutathione lyase family enzyme
MPNPAPDSDPVAGLTNDKKRETVMKKLISAITLFLGLCGSAQAALPGMKGPDHIGFTVPDINQAVRFFVDVIGCDAFYQLGPFADGKGSWMQANLNVHPRAEIPAIRLLRCANGSNLEIFQYSSPDQQATPPKNSDIGGHHLAFYVDDINAAVSYLKAQGVELLGEPKVMTSGPSAGESWVYFLAPWGMQLELVSYPEGKAYEKTRNGRLFSPAGH